MASSTFGLGGLGLLIAPVCPCRVMVTEGDELVIEHADREVARFSPGSRPGSEAATWTGQRAQFGEGGPTLTLADGITLDAVLVRVETGFGEAPWCALGPGFVADLPPGLSLLPAREGDEEDPFFELHLNDTKQEFIRFEPRRVNVANVKIEPAPYQEVVARDVIRVEEAGATRTIDFTQFAYSKDGVDWQQVVFAVPMPTEMTMVVYAQAREENASTLFTLAARIAATLGPIG